MPRPIAVQASGRLKATLNRARVPAKPKYYDARPPRHERQPLVRWSAPLHRSYTIIRDAAPFCRIRARRKGRWWMSRKSLRVESYAFATCGTGASGKSEKARNHVSRSAWVGCSQRTGTARCASGSSVLIPLARQWPPGSSRRAISLRCTTPLEKSQRRSHPQAGAWRTASRMPAVRPTRCSQCSPMMRSRRPSSSAPAESSKACRGRRSTLARAPSASNAPTGLWKRIGMPGSNTYPRRCSSVPSRTAEEQLLVIAGGREATIIQIEPLLRQIGQVAQLSGWPSDANLVQLGANYIGRKPVPIPRPAP